MLNSVPGPVKNNKRRGLQLWTVTLLLMLTCHAQAQFRDRQYPDQRSQQQIEAMHQQARGAMLEGNYAIAYCIWHPMARRGDNAAQYNIGWMYHNGYGLRIDDEIALYWWLKAAATGSADAHFALGDLYANGQGVEKNMAIALGWYISASLQNHEPARETMMTLLASENPGALEIFNILLKHNWSVLGDTMEIKVAKANTRRGPGKNHAIVTTLDQGHPVIPLKERNGWTYIGITGEGRSAWIFSGLIGYPASPVQAEASVE